MRSFWKGSISFGLVSIPVSLYTATASKDPRFHYLHRACHAPVQYKKVCSQCGQSLEKDDIVLGYEVQDGAYVPIEAQDLEALPKGEAQTIAILQFLDPVDLDPVYYLKPYYLEPAKGAAKAYGLLFEAMNKTGKVGLCRIRLRSRPSLALIRPYRKNSLLMETLMDPDEVRSIEDLSLGEPAQPSPKEVELAEALIAALEGHFEPEAHPDEYRTALHDLIEAKAETHQVTAPAATAATGKVVDLMEALRASLAKEEGKDEPLPAHAGQGRR